jgi:hypothetical protein
MNTANDINELIYLLQTHNIPYNKKNIKENIIIIPGGLIKLKYFHTIKNNYDIEQFIKQVYNIVLIYNKLVYIYVSGIENQLNYIEFYNKFYTKVDINCVKLVTNVGEIIVGPFNYIIKSTGALWTFITNYNYFFPIFQNFKILCHIDTYKRAIAIVNDEELAILHTYNMELVDNYNNYIDDNICVITQNTFQERSVFTYVIKYVPLNGGNRSPCRLVDGVTNICPNCNNIAYVDNTDSTFIIRKHNCINTNLFIN